MTEQIKTVKDALTLAIKKELQAYNLYTTTSRKVKSPGTKAMLKELADEEKRHEQLLKSVVAEEKYEGLGTDIPKTSLGIADFLVAVEITENATTQEVMIFAMKEEEKALNFYTDLKVHFSGTELETLFSGLAEEEKGHKIKLEREYDENILREN